MKKNKFLEQLQHRQQAAKAPKPISAMSEAELAAEEDRLKEEVRRLKERGVEALREAREEQESTDTRRIFKRKRPHWR